jgi:hypothetical protein
MPMGEEEKAAKEADRADNFPVCGGVADLAAALRGEGGLVALEDEQALAALEP